MQDSGRAVENKSFRTVLIPYWIRNTGTNSTHRYIIKPLVYKIYDEQENIPVGCIPLDVSNGGGKGRYTPRILPPARVYLTSPGPNIPWIDCFIIFLISKSIYYDIKTTHCTYFNFISLFAFFVRVVTSFQILWIRWTTCSRVFRRHLAKDHVYHSSPDPCVTNAELNVICKFICQLQTRIIPKWMATDGIQLKKKEKW